MRRVGEELGVEAMSLYNHVANKAAIFDGIFETVLAQMPPVERVAGWQEALRERAHGLRSTLRAHPNVVPIFATRAAVTPASIAYVEEGLEVLRTAGFSAEDALSAFQVVLAFVVGHALASYAPTKPDEDSRPAYERLSEEAFPRMREAAQVLASYDIEEEFKFGLEAMLAGIEVRTSQKGRRKRG